MSISFSFLTIARSPSLLPLVVIVLLGCLSRDTMVFCAYCGKSFTRKEHLERHIPSRKPL